MSIDRADFDALSAQDLQELIEAQVPEGLRIEYKAAPYGNADGDKREFLKDISAFANSQGGHLVIGIAENAGVAAALVGVHDINPDTELQRLEQIARGGLEPRIPGLRMKAVRLDHGDHIFVLRVPRSWNPPHRVIAQGSNRFYLRHSAGVHEPNVQELRALFTQSASALDHARQFREERLTWIQSNIDRRPLVDNGRFILHIFPVASSTGAINLSMEEVYQQHMTFQPMGNEGLTPRYNYYGFINERGRDENYGYTQIFRNGALEATKADIIRERERQRGIPGNAIERYFFEVFHPYITGLRDIGVPPPLIIMLTLEGVNAVDYVVSRDVFDDFHPPLPEDTIRLPECVLEDYGDVIDHHRAIRPAFDALWNAIDYPRALSFNADGLWIGRNQR